MSNNAAERKTIMGLGDVDTYIGLEAYFKQHWMISAVVRGNPISVQVWGLNTDGCPLSLDTHAGFL